MEVSMASLLLSDCHFGVKKNGMDSGFRCAGLGRRKSRRNLGRSSSVTALDRVCTAEEVLERPGGDLRFHSEDVVASFVETVKECSRSRDLGRGKRLHSMAIDSGLLNSGSDASVYSSFVEMYARCGSMGDAASVFDESVHRTAANWSALIQGYVGIGKNKLALEVFDAMVEGQYLPSSLTYIAAIRACSLLAQEEAEAAKNSRVKSCSSRRWVEKGKAIHSQIVKSSCFPDVHVETSLIAFYGLCGTMLHARAVFDNMVEPDILPLSALIQGYAENGMNQLAVSLLDALKEVLEDPDPVLYIQALRACASLANLQAAESQKEFTKWLEKSKAVHSEAVMNGCFYWSCNQLKLLEDALVSVYVKCGNMIHARSVFDSMLHPSRGAFTALITGYVENGHSEEALELMNQMKMDGFQPEAVTLAAVLRACGNLMAFEKGEAFHAEIKALGLQHNLIVANGLVEFYGKCGSMELAEEVFECIADKGTSSWNALMCGYSMQGNSHRTFEAFEQMLKQGKSPDRTTFISVLKSCVHAGLVDKGKELFESMTSEYGVSPDLAHYRCMIDLLSRANHLQEALQLVNKMPVEANFVIWMTILEASRKWSNPHVGRIAHENLLRLYSESTATSSGHNQDGSSGMEMYGDYIRSGRREWSSGQTVWTDKAGKVHRLVCGDEVRYDGDIYVQLRHFLLRFKDSLRNLGNPQSKKKK